MEDIQRQLRNLAEEQMPYAVKVALNNTAFSLRSKSKSLLGSTFDRPTPLIRGATRVTKATKETLAAIVAIDPKRAPVLLTHEEGGKRGHQPIERFMVGRGWLPAGWRAVPGKGMPLDAYGNPRRAEVNHILQELSAGISGVHGSARRTFVIPVGMRSHLPPGVWRVRAGSRERAITPLYLFVSSVQYRAILHWEGTASAEAERLLPDEVAKAIRRALATAR